LFALKEYKIRSQEETAWSKNGLDLNNARLCWYLESQKTQDWVTEGKKAEKENEASGWSQGMRTF